MIPIGFFEGRKIEIAKKDDVDVLIVRHPKFGHWMLKRQDNFQTLVSKESRIDILRVAIENELFVYNI